MAKDWVCVGAIAGAFGVRGEVRIKSFTQEPGNILKLVPWCDERGVTILTPTSHRAVKGGFAVKTIEVQTREEAEALKSVRLFVSRAALPDLAEDEFYYSDLNGMRLEGLDGEDLGQIKAVHDFGAGDVLEVFNTPGRKGQWYVPFTKDAVPHVDMKARKLIIDMAHVEGEGEREPQTES